MKHRLDFTSPSKETANLDWSKCFICQEVTKESLINPCGDGTLLKREKSKKATILWEQESGNMNR